MVFSQNCPQTGREMLWLAAANNQNVAWMAVLCVTDGHVKVYIIQRSHEQQLIFWDGSCFKIAAVHFGLWFIPAVKFLQTEAV